MSCEFGEKLLETIDHAYRRLLGGQSRAFKVRLFREGRLPETEVNGAFSGCE
jgi:hypothetical protein